MSEIKFPKPVSRKSWGLNPTLDFYLLREFLVPFSVLIIGFVLIFVIADLCNDLSDFMEHGASISKLLFYLLLRLPGNVRFILPLSVLLATMYTLANMGKNMEITAIRASGVSLFRCCGAIFGMGILVTIVNFWFNEQVVPYSDRKAIIMRKTVANKNYEDKFRKMLTYRSGDNRRTWLFEYFTDDEIQKNVVVKKYRSGVGRILEWDLQADEARCIPGEGWEFKNVVKTPYNAEGLLPMASEKYEIYKIGTDEIPETPREIMDVSKPPVYLSSLDILNLVTKTDNMHQNLRNIYNTIFYYRLAFPWACFLAVFIGAPLATKNERRGVMTSIILSVVVIIIYQMSSEAFLILGKRGVLPPFVAGVAPTISFILYGCYGVFRQV